MTVLIVALSLGVALSIAPSIWGLLEVSRIPETAWAAIGRRKSNWVIVFALGIWAWFVGVVGAIVYLTKVRPALRSVLAERGEPLTPLKPALWVAGVLVAGLALVGAWLYVTAENHDETIPPRLAESANSVCRDAHAEHDALSELPGSATFEERAQRVERTLAIFERMVGRLRALDEGNRNATYDTWLDHWDEYISAGPAYADAIRTGDPSIYEPAGNEGDAPAVAFNTMAKENGIDACVF